MAYDVSKLTRLQDLKSLATKINDDFATKAEVSNLANAFKSGQVIGNTVKLYTSTDKSGTAAFEFDFPAELFLDQTKTQFVPAFAFSTATYAGATDPNLDGKPVMVLAVKGENNEITYSFLDMAALVDTYKPKAGDGTATVTVSGYEISVNVNISAESDNALVKKDDGLYVPKADVVDISGKTDKVDGATAGNFAGLDANGNLTDSGKAPTDFSKVEASTTAGAIKVDGADVAVVEIATDAEVTEMLDEVFGTGSTGEDATP